MSQSISLGDRRNPMACRRCRRLKKKCKKIEGREQCGRCIESGNCTCEFLDVASDLEASGLATAGPSSMASPENHVPPNAFSSSQPGLNQRSICPYVQAVLSESSPSNPITYPPPPYPPPEFVSITNGDARLPAPLPHISISARQEADLIDPAHRPSFQRSHISGSPRSFIRPLPPNHNLSNYDLTHLMVCIPDVSTSPSSSSNNSPYENHPYSFGANGGIYLTSCGNCTLGNCAVHFGGSSQE